MSHAKLRKLAFAYCGVYLFAAFSGVIAMAASVPALVIAFGLAKRRKWALWALYVHAVGVFAAGVLIAKPASIALAIFALAFAVSHVRRPPKKIPVFEPARVSLRVRVGQALVHTAEINENAVIVWMDPSVMPVKSRVQAEVMANTGQVVRFAAIVRTSSEKETVKLEIAEPTLALRTQLRDLVTHNRRHGRVQIALPALLEHHEEITDAVTHDVSISGCYVACATSGVRMGEKIHVTLALHANDPLTLMAEVVWKRDIPSHGKPAGIALKFAEVTPEMESRILSRLIESERKAA